MADTTAFLAICARQFAICRGWGPFLLEVTATIKAGSGIEPGHALSQFCGRGLLPRAAAACASTMLPHNCLITYCVAPACQVRGHATAAVGLGRGANNEG